MSSTHRQYFYSRHLTCAVLMSALILNGPARASDGAHTESSRGAPSESVNLHEFLESSPPTALGQRGGKPLFPNGTQPDRAFVEALIEEAHRSGITLTAKQVLAAAPYYREQDDIADLIEIPQIAPLLVAAAIWCAKGAAMSVGLGFSLNALFDYPYTKKDFWIDAGLGCISGGATGAARNAAKAALKGATFAEQAVPKVDLAFDVTTGAIDGTIASIRFAQSASHAQFQRSLEVNAACAPFVNTTGSSAIAVSSMNQLAEDCFGESFTAYWLEEIVDTEYLVGTTGLNPDPILTLGMLLAVDDRFATLPAPSDTIDIQLALVPLEVGSAPVSLYVRHEGIDYLLRTAAPSFSEADLSWVFTTTFSVPVSELEQLSPTGNREFRFWSRTTMNGATSDYFSATGNGHPLRIGGPANDPPIAFVGTSATGSLVTFRGSYRDLEGDAPATLRIDFQGATSPPSVDLLPHVAPGPYTTAREFLHSLTLPDGAYTYTLTVSDGLNTIQTDPQSLRISSSPPVVTVWLSSGSATLNEVVQGTLTVIDAVGPVPNLPVGLQTDKRSPFFNSAGEMARKVSTNASGQAQFQYRPEISGQHTVLAMEPGHHQFAWTTLDVQGNPSDWTTAWSWSLQSSTGEEATYEVQVFIQHQGQNLSPGDYVFFSANHGQFQDDEDQVGASSVAVNIYTLTAAEAAQGNEIITLYLPEYGVQLQHVTDLPVGSPTEITAPRSLSILANNQDNYSYGVTFSQNGAYVAFIAGNNVVILNASDLSPVRTVTTAGDPLNCVAFSPDSTKIAAGDRDGNISVITVATGATIISSKTDGHADIVNLHWYAPDRIAAVTGGYSTGGYTPKVLMMNSALSNVVAPISLSGLSATEDLRRITCNSTSQLCAVASDYDDNRWFLVTTSGTSVYSSPPHPDMNAYFALAFNQAGNKLFVGGDDNAGATVGHLYSVSSGGVSSLPGPFPLSSDLLGAQFFFEGTAERLVIGGREHLEVFSDSGGPALRSRNEPLWTTQQSYYLNFLSGNAKLAVITNNGQSLYNFSGDQEGPSISISQPPPLPFAQDSTTVFGSVSDPAGVAAAEYRVAGGAWQPLSLDGGGQFAQLVNGLSVGDTLFEIDATDALLNQSGAEITITRQADTAPPFIGNVSVLPAVGSPGTAFSVSCHVEDFGTGVGSVSATVRLAGVAIATVPFGTAGGGDYSATVDSTGYSVGSYSVDIAAADLATPPNTAEVVGAGSFIVQVESSPHVTVTALDGLAGEPDDNGTYRIARSGSTASSLSVNITMAGTATNGSDYQNISTPRTIPAGASYVDVPLTIINDSIVESTETATINLQSGAGYTVGSPSSATINITDDDAATPTVTVANLDGTAGEPSDNGSYRITRSGSAASSLNVNITMTGTASSGSDYQAISSPRTIPAGQSYVDVPLTIINDSTVESTETAILNLQSGVGYTVGSPASATLNITDDDSAGGALFSSDFESGWFRDWYAGVGMLGSVWHLDEGSGTTAADSFGSDHGTVGGASWASGHGGTALDFGTPDTSNVMIPRSVYDGFGDSAYVEAWIYPTAYPASGNVGTIFRKRGAFNDWALELRPDGTLSTYIAGAGGINGTGLGVVSLATVPLNQWTRVASHYDGDELRLLLNDIVVAADTLPLELDWDAPTCPGDQYYDDGCYYGSWIGITSIYSRTSVAPGTRFSGKIDEVLIYSEPISGSGVLAFDLFEDGVISNWTTYGGCWSESDGLFHCSTTPANSAISAIRSDGTSWTNYAVEVDVKPLSTYQPSATGIVFRFESEYPIGQFCDCSLYRYQGTYLYLYCLGGPAYTTPFPFGTTEFYRLRATVSGDLLTCEVVGAPGVSLSGTFPSIPSQGSAGLRSTHIASDFDNFLVTSY